VGSVLISKLTGAGHEVRRLVRGGALREGDIAWDPVRKTIDRERLSHVDAVIHLAGENIGGGRWTDARKRSIRESRVAGTQLIADTMAELATGPRILLCASAIGYYGDRDDEILDEESSAASDFLGEVCVAWEAAARPARQAGLRVAQLRLGIVLAREGGALPRMLPPFRMGVGGILGDGRQWWSWVDVEDVARAFLWALENDSARGAYNCVAPQPLRNRDFTSVLGKVLHRPTLLPAPAFALRLLLGEMADSLLLGSARVQPKRLVAEGFQFAHPELEAALRRHLK